MHLHKSFVRLLLFFYLFSSFASATHIHHDMHASQDDCKVCIVVKNLHSADIPSAFFFEPICYAPIHIAHFSTQRHSYVHYKYIDSQAPPLFS